MQRCREMFGAMIGDIAGSPYKIKKYNVHTKDFQFLTEYSYGPEGRGFESLTAYQKSSKSSDFEDFCFS